MRSGTGRPRGECRLAVTIADPAFPRDAGFVRRAARAVLRGEPRTLRGRIGVRIVAGREMAAWNRRLLGRRGATDVISVCYTEGAPVPDPEGWTGDLLVCWPVAVRQARRFAVAPLAEWRRYLVHGLLHLAGYDHERSGAAAARRMRRREAHYLGD